MEIYLKFAGNKAIMAKRQGQQEESTREKGSNLTAARLRRVSLRSRAAVFGLYRLSLGSCLSESSRLLKAVLTHAAQGTFKVLRYLAPGRSRRDAALRVTCALVVFPTAKTAYILHCASSFLFSDEFIILPSADRPPSR